MTGKFSLEELEKHARSIYGVARVLRKDFDECAASKTLHSHAEGILRETIRCILISWEDPLDDLLAKAERFLAGSLDSDECETAIRMGTVARNLGLCRWLMQQPSAAVFSQMAAAYLRVPTDNVSWDDLDIFLIDLVSGDQSESAVALVKGCGLRIPDDGRQSGAVFVYRMALANCGATSVPSPSEDDVEAYVLKQIPEPLLTRGHYVRLAMLMKLWQSGSAAHPFEQVRRCLRYAR